MNPIHHINNPYRIQSMMTGLLKICCLTSLGFACISQVSGGSRVNAVMGISSAMRSIINICVAVIANGMPRIPHASKLNKTANNSPPLEATARIADFFIF